MKQHIGLGGVFSIATGAMISSGIFILPSLAFDKLGSAASLSYLIAGIFALFGSLSIVELATAMPKDGGDYYYVNKTFGGFFGTISGLFGWFALSLKSAFAIFGIGEVLFRFLAIPPLWSGLLLCVLFIVLNARGTKEAIVLQNLLVLFLLLLLFAYVVLGIGWGFPSPKPGQKPIGFWHSLQSSFQLSHLNSADKWLSLLSVSGFVFVSFGGLLKVTNVSEQIHRLKRNLPLGMILAISTVTLLYVLINVLLIGIMPAELLRNSLAPVADSARRILQNQSPTVANIAYHVVLLGSLLAFITTANAGIMAASRYPMALSRDKLLPSWIAKVHPSRHTPIPALLLTGLIIAIALFLPLATLIKTASAMVLSSYILTNLALIIFRESRVLNYQPSFSAPFYPWLQIACIIVFSFFIMDIGLQAIEASVLLLAFSIAVYHFYGRKHGSKNFALVYLLRRIIDKHLDHDSLEEELFDLLLHRDEIQLNVFQALAQKASILDLPYTMTFANMLKAGCKVLAEETGMAPELLEQQFLQRQAEGTTAFSPFLAIPHFIIADEQDLCMQIIRCKEGIFFDEQHPEVKAIFLLCGSQQKRREHLECLAAIATMAENTSNFEARWQDAANTSELRNLVLSPDGKL